MSIFSFQDAKEKKNQQQDEKYRRLLHANREKSGRGSIKVAKSPKTQAWKNLMDK